MKPEKTTIGSMAIEPAGPVEAGAVGTWALTFTVGKAGIATGGGFRIMPPVTVVGEHYNLVRWQLNTVSVSGPKESTLSADIVLLNKGRYDGAFAYIIEVKNLGRPLKAGETVLVKLEHAVASRFAMPNARFEVEVDPTGERRYSCVGDALPSEQLKDILNCFRLADPPSVDVLPGPAVMLRAAASARPEARGRVRLTLSARDAFMNRARGFRGRVVLASPLEVGGLPDSYEFIEKDQGACVMEGLSLRKPGVVRIHAKVADKPIECVSSPIAPDFPMPVFFGDMHCHHNLNRGPEGAAELCEHARDFAGLEFVAMTDYDRNKIACREITRRYYEPGRFVTLFAEEWSDRETADHRNVYYREDPGQTVCRAANTPALFEQFRDSDVIVIPHTTNIDCLVGWKHTDWSRHDPRLQGLVEICQIRGDCEEEGPVASGPKGGHGGSVRTALARGLRVGFIGGSDTHRGTPGGPGHELHPLVKSTGAMFWGQTGVLAAELTREAVFDALRERRCYATTGARILLWFEINGQPMGSEIRGAGPPRIGIRFHAEEPVTELSIVKNGRVWRRLSPNELDFQVELPDDSICAGANYYYVRLTQGDGHRAWSSPIWVDQ